MSLLYIIGSSNSISPIGVSLKFWSTRNSLGRAPRSPESCNISKADFRWDIKIPFLEWENSLPKNFQITRIFDAKAFERELFETVHSLKIISYKQYVININKNYNEWSTLRSDKKKIISLWILRKSKENNHRIKKSQNFSKDLELRQEKGRLSTILNTFIFMYLIFPLCLFRWHYRSYSYAQAILDLHWQ